MTLNRSSQWEIRALLLGACVVSLSACSGRALILDGAPPNPVRTVDAGAVVETLPLPDEIQEFWVDDTRLYWLTLSGEARSCLHDDCEHTTITYGSPGYNLTLSDHDVFWGPGPFLSCPKAGCTGAPTAVVNDPDMRASCGDGDYFYWASAFDTYRCPSSGCGDIPEVVVLGERALDLKFAGSRAYWSRTTGLADAGTPTPLLEIRSAPKDGSEPPMTIHTISDATYADFAVDTTNLYWINDSFQVQSCPLDGCDSQSPTALATSDHQKAVLKVDASGLYWYEPSENLHIVIGFCPLSGCGSESRALTDAEVGSYASDPFALDSTYVYWQERAASGSLDTKSIRRTRKPTP